MVASAWAASAAVPTESAEKPPCAKPFFSKATSSTLSSTRRTLIGAVLLSAWLPRGDPSTACFSRRLPAATSERVTPSDDLFALGPRRRPLRRLEPRQADGLERTTLVFLHEGLGCIEMWRDFPQKLCDATRTAGIVYDRTGYGGSSPCTDGPGRKEHG